MSNTAMSKRSVDRVVARLGRAHVYERFEAPRTALVVVDMQNYFMKPGMPACCDAARDIVPAVNGLAAALRLAGGAVMWIQTEALPESAGDWKNLYEIYAADKQKARLAELAKDAEGYRLWPALDVAPEDEVVVKLRYSAFIDGSSDIERRLRDRGIDTVLIAGVATNVCCESTARDAMMRDFRTVMVADALAAVTVEEHRASLETFYVYFGDVQTSDQVMDRLDTVVTAATAATAAE